MKSSIIFDIIESAYFESWHAEILKADTKGYLQAMFDSKQLLTDKLSDEYKNLIENYSYSVETYFENKYYEMCEKLLNIGIKIGMDMQSILSED